MKKYIFALLLCAGFALPALGQSTPPTTWQEADGSPKVTPPKTIIVPNGSISGKTVTLTGGGGSGCTPPGTANRVLYDNGAGGCTSAAGFTFNGSGTISLGVAGSSVGAIGFRNATSGTITLQPVTGALGTVTLSLPAVTDTLVGLAATQTLTNKTLTAPVIAQISNTGTLTLPTSTDTLVGRATTDTLTNKTLSTSNTVSAALTWTAGVKQTFAPNGTTAGINVGSVAGDPSAPANGDLWYDSTANELTARINGANVALGSGGGGGITIGTTTITSGTNTRVLYNNAGVVGEYTVTGTAGNVVLSTSPTITTPAITTSQTTTRDSIGVTSTDGIVLQNTTAATAGNQQWSPRLRLKGSGWKTNATAAAQDVEHWIESKPIQGTSAPTNVLSFNVQTNGSGGEPIFVINDTGVADGATFYFGRAWSTGPTDIYNSITTSVGGMDFQFNGTSVAGLAQGSRFDVYVPLKIGPSSTTAVSLRNPTSGGNTLWVTTTATSTVGGNLVLGQTATGVGTSGTATFAIENGTAPSSRPADRFQLYAADYAAGDSRANILSENNATPVTIGNHSVLTGYQHLTKTADYTVVTADSNAFFDNVGAGAGVVFTLPTPTASPSLKYTFCRVANQTVTVDIGGSVTIRSGANVTTSGGNVTLDAVGSCLTIYSISSTEWYASSSVGTLTFN